MDPISEQRLKELCPALAACARQMETLLLAEGIVIRITQGLRSWNDQAKLYAIGRDDAGNVVDQDQIVTKAKPGTSWHQFGLAFDVAPDDPAKPGFQPDWNLNHPQWKRIVEVGESLGLFSGTDFKTFKDWPHFQLTGKFPAVPTDEVRQIFHDAGMEQIWKEAGLQV